MNLSTDVNERKYIRHPIDIPIEYYLVDSPLYASDSMNNISNGGLSFCSTDYIQPQSWLHIHIPVNDEHFEVDALVCWCQKHDDHFDVGVNFVNQTEAFSARMVEQICHIEQYKKEVLCREGRDLSQDEAASEWIEKFAQRFPQN